MVTKFWIIQILTALLPGVFSIELLPERYLKPQDFNYHPITDVGIPAALKKALKAGDSYAILSKKRPREGREFPPQNAIYYPTPHPSVISRKYVETNEINKYDDPYVRVPKNYAFSYIVKDQHSGDDFSHSQAHNGKATKGQYRVKLPDGRTQVVSYTADHKGYRADVQYEEDLVHKTLVKPVYVQNVADAPTKHLHVTPQEYKASYVPTQVQSNPAQIVYTVTAKPVNYVPSSTTASPVQYVANNTPLNLVVKSTVAPAAYYQPQYVSTTAAPYVQQQYVTTTASPQYIPEQHISQVQQYVPQQQVSAAQYVPQQHVSSTPLYPVEQAAANTAAAAYHHNVYQNYQAVSTTASPEHAVIVTPRPAYNRAITKNDQSGPLYYRLL